VLKVKAPTSGKGGRKWGTLLKPFTTEGTGEHRGILIHVWYWLPEITGG